MMNSKKPKQKVSNIMRKMNYLLYSVFAFQLLIILTFATLSCIWQSSNAKSFVYLDLSENVGVSTWIVQLLTYWVTFSHMIPISLYVIIEMLKLIQAYIINKDIELYSYETNQYGKCNNSDLIEELGQVEFIFSDKTGTLTMNKMVLKKCSIIGKVYGELEEGENQREGICESSVKKLRKTVRKNPDHPSSRAIHQFLVILSVCHTVVCDRDPNDKDKILYQSSSPDELALVQAGKDIGFEMISRSSEEVTIYNKILDREEVYEILVEFPFNSDRKRMSIILRYEGKLYLYSKGADSVMLPRIHFDSDKDMELQKGTEDNLHKFASDGLRVLVIGYKEISDKEFMKFSDKFDKIRTNKAIKQKSKESELDKLFDDMEKNLLLIGCTAIEDKLQDGVPETIGLLREADINIWMLTGDKMETAIEIAKSCNLFDSSMTELLFSFDSLEMINQTLDSELKYLELKELFEEEETISVVVDGTTLQLIFSDPQVTENFFRLCRASKSVVCCRVSPKQKSDIVDNYMNTQSGICIAIGDGANDVPMIMQAHIGVGIRGLEGTQAVRTADFAINQFSHLQKLLLVHGRWGYKRVAYMICYYFYKNIVLALCEIYFHLYNGFSGQIYFLDWLPMLYNSFFTSFPCLFTFSLEQDANIENSYYFPMLYKGGQKEVYFNMKVFWRWILFSIWHGLT
jgi:phospholipid-transporting ATPase